MMYSAIQVADAFKVARETIRKWAIEFDSYLSPSARPASGGIRRFTDSDIEVFALVSEMKDQGKVFDDIHAALRAGQRGDPPAVAAEIATSPSNQQLALQNQLTELQIELRVSRLRNDDLREQNAALQAKIDRLNREIGRLEAGKD